MQDFIFLIIPFIIIGILLAIIIINTKDKDAKDTYICEGMCFGIVIGFLLGNLLQEHFGLFLSGGMLIGQVIGSYINK